MGGSDSLTRLERQTVLPEVGAGRHACPADAGAGDVTTAVWQRDIGSVVLVGTRSGDNRRRRFR